MGSKQKYIQFRRKYLMEIRIYETAQEASKAGAKLIAET